MKITTRRQTQRIHRRAFSLIEMMVVIAIMSVLMTAGVIGLAGMGGKGVASGVAIADSLFDEARSIAVGQRTNSRLMVANDLTNNPAENFRKIVVMYSEIDPDTGNQYSPKRWALSSRGASLPDQTYFSSTYSKQSHEKQENFATAQRITLSKSEAKSSFEGSYTAYEFNSEGICQVPGASFVIGAGARAAGSATDLPKVTSAAKRDFGGFIIWRNGKTSLFRTPDQINPALTAIKAGDRF